MRKLWGIIIIIQMLFITIPIEAGRDNIYTAVTDISPSSEWILANNVSYTSIRFDIKSEILNTGSDFEQWFPNTNTEDLRGTVSLGGLEYEIVVETVSPMVTLKSYPANKRVEYEFHFSIKSDGQVLDILSVGEISFWIYTNQPEVNTFYAYLKSDGDTITYEYDVLPEFWDDYALYNESEPVTSDPVISSVIEYPWDLISVVTVVSFALVHKKQKERKN